MSIISPYFKILNLITRSDSVFVVVRCVRTAVLRIACVGGAGGAKKRKVGGGAGDASLSGIDGVCVRWEREASAGKWQAYSDDNTRAITDAWHRDAVTVSRSKCSCRSGGGTVTGPNCSCHSGGDGTVSRPKCSCHSGGGGTVSGPKCSCHCGATISGPKCSCHCSTATV